MAKQVKKKENRGGARKDAGRKTIVKGTPDEVVAVTFWIKQSYVDHAGGKAEAKIKAKEAFINSLTEINSSHQ